MEIKQKLSSIESPHVLVTQLLLTARVNLVSCSTSPLDWIILKQILNIQFYQIAFDS